MGISLLTNVDTSSVLRNLDRTQRGISTQIQQLSSGARINRAADDAAGLAISEQLEAGTRGTAQAIRNAQDGISMIQVAEGSLNEIHSLYQRMRELAVQSANGTQNDTTRGFLDQEYQALYQQIDQIANSTNFNGIKMLDVPRTFQFQIGAYAVTTENTVSVTIVDHDPDNLAEIAGTTVSTAAQALVAISAMDWAIDDASTTRGMIGAAQNRLALVIDNLASSRENLLAARSRIRDADVATLTSELARSQILAQAGVSVLAQANQLPAVGLSLLR